MDKINKTVQELSEPCQKGSLPCFDTTNLNKFVGDEKSSSGESGDSRAKLNDSGDFLTHEKLYKSDEDVRMKPKNEDHLSRRFQSHSFKLLKKDDFLFKKLSGWRKAAGEKKQGEGLGQLGGPQKLKIPPLFFKSRGVEEKAREFSSDARSCEAGEIQARKLIRSLSTLDEGKEERGKGWDEVVKDEYCGEVLEPLFKRNSLLTSLSCSGGEWTLILFIFEADFRLILLDLWGRQCLLLSLFECFSYILSCPAARCGLLLAREALFGPFWGVGCGPIPGFLLRLWRPWVAFLLALDSEVQ